MDIYIDKPDAKTKDLTNTNISINDFGKLRLWQSNGFHQNKENTACFILQVRTIGPITSNSKIDRKIISKVHVSITDLREMLKYAESNLTEHRKNIAR